MKTPSDSTSNLYFLSGGGEMGELTRSYNWSHTELGNPDRWPQSLKTTLGIVLHSAFPMFLFWGKELTCFYNDAFRPSLGIDGKHPAVGKKGKEVWGDVWEFSGPLIEGVMRTGEPVWFQDQLVPFYRNGKMEEIYWTFSYSPAYGDHGGIDGVFVTCTETTKNIFTLKQLEESALKLQESERNLRNIVSQAPVAMSLFKGPDFKVEVTNPKALELWGRTNEEVVGRPIFDVMPEARAQGYEDLMKNVYNTGESYRAFGKGFSVTRNGQQDHKYVSFTYEPYRDSNGSVTGVMSVSNDVTAEFMARNELEKSEQQIRSLVESAPFPIGVYIGKEMRIQLANQNILDVWGKGNDVIGKLYREVLPELDNQQIFEQLDGVFTSGIAFHAKNQRLNLVVNGENQPFYFNYSFTPLYNSDGEVYGVMNTAADVTDLNIARQKTEQSERNFRNMILQAPVAMCILVGPDHVVEVANGLMIELWGKPEADVMNKPIFVGLPDAKEQGLEQLLKNVYETGETFEASERPVMLFRNGQMESVYQDFVYEPYRNSDGTILGVLASSIDVTAQVLARREIEEIVNKRTEELELANKNLQKSNAELAQFAYIASHDLQEPLRKITTFTQMLESRAGDLLDEQSKNYLSKINSSSQRMNALIRDVLAYSELVKEAELFSKVDLNKVVESTLVDYELLIEQKGATVHYKDLPVIEAIPLQMSQLIGNIIGNSLKFSKKDVLPVITITASALSEEEKNNPLLDPSVDYCKIRFSDNGIGFKPEYAAQIFNIFQRLHRKSEYEGTGIGLAMCKKIALNHHGDLNADGTSENGAVFNAILPMKRIIS